MNATQLSCGVVLVSAVREGNEIVVDFLAAYPRRLGTLRIAARDDDRDLYRRLRGWVVTQTPVWVVEGRGTATVTASSCAVERILETSHAD